MVRLARRTLIGLFAATFLATTAMWVRSYFVHDTLSWIPHEFSYSIFFERGNIGLMACEKFVKGHHDGHHWQHFNAGSKLSYADRHFGPIGWGSHFADPGKYGTVVLIPFWLVFSALATKGLVVMALMFRTRKMAVGVCSNCGYDLRATPSRCPECGKTPLQGQPTAG